MSTVLEIEHALESLPTSKLLEVGEWLDEQRAMILGSEAMFQKLDEEEGTEAGTQWLG